MVDDGSIQAMSGFDPEAAGASGLASEKSFDPDDDGRDTCIFIARQTFCSVFLSLGFSLSLHVFVLVFHLMYLFVSLSRFKALGLSFSIKYFIVQ